MRWLKKTNEILKEQPEEWLAYLYGQKLNELPHLTNKKTKGRGVILGSIVFFIKIFRNYFLSHENLKKGNFFIFAQSMNQYNSLKETADELKKQKQSVDFKTDYTLFSKIKNKKEITCCHFSLEDISKATILFFTKAPKLYLRLRKKNHIGAKLYFDSFCMVYIWLIYFQRILDHNETKFIITANDHNVPCRCLLATAHFLNKKTVYLQHASVSNIFPCLRMNYAFLDGKHAYSIYTECEKNIPLSIREKSPIPEIYFSGQKKYIKKTNNTPKKTIGLAINMLDDQENVIKLIKRLKEKNINILLRWHPGTSTHDIKKYKLLEKEIGFNFSDPSEESINDYLDKLKIIISGNSSIHLEAALKGVYPIYYEIAPSKKSDYYGYVKNGVSKLAYNFEELLILLKSPLSQLKPSSDSLQFYSSTYNTEWEGIEGKLVANCLIALLKQNPDLSPISSIKYTYS